MPIHVLAGGFATRLWPLTEHRAKPLLRLGGQSILSWVLSGVDSSLPVTILTNQRFVDDFGKEMKALGRDFGFFIEDSVADGEKLGALMAVSQAMKANRDNNEQNKQETLYILPGDSVLPEFNLKMLACEPNEAKIILKDIGNKDEARKFGVAQVNEAGKLVGFEEKPQNPKTSLVSTGFMSLGSDLVDLLHKRAAEAPDNLGGMVPYLLGQGIDVKTEIIKGEWYDVGSFGTYLDAHRAFGKQTKPKTEDNNVYEGMVEVDSSSKIQNSYLKDCLIYPNVKIENCHLVNCIIDENVALVGVDMYEKLLRKGLKIKNENRRSVF